MNKILRTDTAGRYKEPHFRLSIKARRPTSTTILVLFGKQNNTGSSLDYSADALGSHGGIDVPCFDYLLNYCDLSAGFSSDGTRVLHAFVQ